MVQGKVNTYVNIKKTNTARKWCFAKKHRKNGLAK